MKTYVKFQRCWCIGNHSTRWGQEDPWDVDKNDLIWTMFRVLKQVLNIIQLYIHIQFKDTN